MPDQPTAWVTRGSGTNRSATAVDTFVQELVSSSLKDTLSVTSTQSQQCAAQLGCVNTITVGAGCTLSGVDLTQTCLSEVDFTCTTDSQSASDGRTQALIRQLVDTAMEDYRSSYQPDASAAKTTQTASIMYTLGTTIATNVSQSCNVYAEATNAFLCTGSSVTDSVINQCNYTQVAISCLQSSPEFLAAYRDAQVAFTGQAPPGRFRSPGVGVVSRLAWVVSGLLLALTALVLGVGFGSGARLTRGPAFVLTCVGLGVLGYALAGYLLDLPPFRDPYADPAVSASDVAAPTVAAAQAWNGRFLGYGCLLGAALVGVGVGFF